MNESNSTPVYFRGSLSVAEGRTIPVIVTALLDISCRVECAEMLPIGVPFQLDVPGQNRACVSARWSTVGKAALVFIEKSSE
jgi:hypothetical protein